MNMIVQGFYPWTQNDRGILSLELDYQTNESKDKMDQSVFKFPKNFTKKNTILQVCNADQRKSQEQGFTVLQKKGQLFTATAHTFRKLEMALLGNISQKRC